MQVDRPTRSTETSEWALTVVGGPSAGTRPAWDQAEMVLGREAVGAALFRGDPAVSRRHAVLRMLDGTCVVEDHSSKNGTFVNNVLIDRPTVLGPEDELRIASTRLRLAPAAGDTALLAAIPVLDPEAAAWDGTASGGPTAPQPSAVARTPATGGPRVHKAGKLALSVLAAIAGTVLASALDGSPQLRLAAAALGSAVPSFMTEPGRYQRARITAMVVLMAGALFVTYGGATLFSYLTDHAAIYPVPPVVPPPAHKATPTPTLTPTGMPTWPVSPTLTGPASATPTAPVSPTPAASASPSLSPTPTSSLTPSPGSSNMPPPTLTPSPTGP
jgi:hypothetical protein